MVVVPTMPRVTRSSRFEAGVTGRRLVGEPPSQARAERIFKNLSGMSLWGHSTNYFCRTGTEDSLVLAFGGKS